MLMTMVFFPVILSLLLQISHLKHFFFERKKEIPFNSEYKVKEIIKYFRKQQQQQI